jgi:hypothetical protein
MKLTMLCKHGNENLRTDPCTECAAEEQHERRTALNMSVDGHEVIKTLRLTAQLLTESGWCSLHRLHRDCSATDVPSALTAAVELAGNRGGLWLAARGVLMKYLGINYSLASWNDAQTDANKVVAEINAAADALEKVLPPRK